MTKHKIIPVFFRSLCRQARTFVLKGGAKELSFLRDYLCLKKSGLFDSHYYVARHPDLEKISDKLGHFIKKGCFERRNPNLLFDVDFYIAQCPEIESSRQNALVHFIRKGWQQGFSPHPLFDVPYFLNHCSDKNSDPYWNPLLHLLKKNSISLSSHHFLFDVDFYVAQTGIQELRGQSPLVHYLTKGSAAGIKPHVLFDPEYYRSKYPDVKGAGMEPLTHYVIRGAGEGRNPHPLFDTKFYWRTNAGTRALRTSALEHFCKIGQVEGRNPCAVFDMHFYRDNYGHTFDSSINPLEHYLLVGASRGNQPNALFDPHYYLEQCNDSTVSKQNALIHYLQIGHKLGLDPHPLFNSTYYLGSHPELREIAISPLSHFLESGMQMDFEPNPMFDSEFYRHKYGDSIVSNTGSFAHYMHHGWRQNLKPNACFDPINYSARRMEEASGENPLQHFLLCVRSAHGQISNLPYPAVPKVSIIILSKNDSHSVIDCLWTVWRNTEAYDYDFETIVIDNGSDDFHLSKLKAVVGNFRLIEIRTDRGRGEGYNIGADTACGAYLVFLDSDISVQTGWLEPLISSLELDHSVGVVAPKIVFPDWTVQEAGCELVNYEMEPIGAGVKDSEFSVNEQKFVDCVSLGVFAVRKDDFIQMLGFDLSYDPIYYEDADLCLKFKEVMLRSLYVPGSVVVHHNSCRVAQSQNDSSLKLRNRATFEHRWRNRSAHGNGEPKAERIFPTENIGIGPINLSPSKVAVYTPYPLIKGGGEKFILSLASVLKGDAPPLILSNHLWSRSRLLTQTRALGIDINEFRLQTYSSVNGADQNLELFFSLGNNLFPEVRGIAKRNFYICQFPFPSDAPMNNDSKKWLYEYSAVIFYSEFVRGYYLSQLSAANLPEIDTFVLSPPIKRLIGNQVKDKKILHVGRFFAGGHQKKQLELVRAFRDLYSNGDLLDWELHLVGSVHHEVSAADYFLQVASEATGFPIFIHPEITEEELEDLYKCSSIYWHATGLGIDEQLSPWAHEHFGMSTVEAMGAGCIPLVIGTGGQKEIVVHGKSGFHWKTINELKQQTISLTKQYGSPENEVMRSAAELRAEHYNFVKFREKLHDLLERKNAPVSQR